MNVKFEKDASGRLVRIITDGVATEVIYDANGKVDGYTTNGATTKVRMATDINRNPVMRFFDSKDNELQPIDLKSAGFPSAVVDSMSGDKIMPTADMIDVKEFARMELQRASQKSAHAMSIRAATKSLAKSDIDCGRAGPDGDCLDNGGGVGGGGTGGIHGLLTPQQQRVCVLRCDLNRDIGLNNCDRAANLRIFACAAGGALLIEAPPVAAVAAGACIAYSSDRTAECRDGIARTNYQCAAACE